MNQLSKFRRWSRSFAQVRQMMLDQRVPNVIQVPHRHFPVPLFQTWSLQRRLKRETSVGD